jgi:hypothetical protein
MRGRLYEANRKPGPIVEVACWAHGRRKFFDLARINNAPIAEEAVARIDALFAIERTCLRIISTSVGANFGVHAPRLIRMMVTIRSACLKPR